MKRLFSIFTLSIIAFACGREVLPEEPVTPSDEQSQVPTVTYTLRLGDDETAKGTLADDGTFSWKAGDRIAVLDSNTGNIHIFTGRSTGESGFEFSVDLPEGDYDFARAWYPANVVGESALTSSITLPSSYSYDDVKTASVVPLAASINENILSFSHMAGILKLTINDVPANATTLELSSPDARICGDFTLSETGIFNATGEDAENGSHVITKNDYSSPCFVEEIKAGTGSSSISVNLSLAEKTTVIAYIPVATGSYNFTISLKAGEEVLLSKSTSSAKTISRATFMKMGALAVGGWTTTNHRLTGMFCKGDTEYSFSTATAQTLAFEETPYRGWFKVDGLKFIGDKAGGAYNTARRIRFRVMEPKNETQANRQIGLPSAENGRGFIAGELISFESGQNGDVKFYAPDYDDNQEFTVYYNPAECKVFILESEKAFAVPSAIPSEADKACLVYLNGTISRSLRLVEDNTSWRCVKGIAANTSVLFRHVNSYLTLTLGANTDGTHVTGRLIEAGTNAFSFDQDVDIYVSADASTIFALPAGSAFSIPARYEGEDASIAEETFKANSAYGVYNFLGKYTAQLEAKDQYSVAGSTFTLMKGWTFDRYIVSGVPSSANVDDAFTITVGYENNLTSATRSATLNTKVVKMDGSKLWLYDSANGQGVIVRAGNSDSGTLSTEARTVYVPTIPKGEGRTGSITVPVVLVAFSDKDFREGSVETLNARFNTDEHSIRQYYYDNSGGKLTITFDLLGPIKTSYSESACADKTNYVKALKQALDILDPTVDFSEYKFFSKTYFDNNIDLITIHAGSSRQSGGTVPSYASNEFGVEYDGFIIRRYSSTPELESGTTVAQVGHATHEFGHTLGLYDWYNTGSQTYKPLGQYSVMDYGDYNCDSAVPAGYNTVERIMTGFETEESIVPITTSGAKTLYRMGTDPGNVHALFIPTELGDVTGSGSTARNRSEGFICEFRSNSFYWDSQLPNNGIVVFHIDRSPREVTVNDKTRTADLHWLNGLDGINNTTSHPLFYVVHANDRSARFAGSSSSDYIPFPGKGNVTRYNPVSWDEICTYVSLTDIPSTTSGDTMTFNAHVREFPMINDPKNGSYSNGDTFKLAISQGAMNCKDVVSWYVNGTLQTGSSVTLSSGHTVIEANLANKQHLYLEINVQ